eukprot:scaffold109846_cov36-Prasinocladus_malaysianus.AAC.2
MDNSEPTPWVSWDMLYLCLMHTKVGNGLGPTTHLQTNLASLSATTVWKNGSNEASCENSSQRCSCLTIMTIYYSEKLVEPCSGIFTMYLDISLYNILCARASDRGFRTNPDVCTKLSVIRYVRGTQYQYWSARHFNVLVGEVLLLPRLVSLSPAHCLA